jgi:hypothetical protein
LDYNIPCHRPKRTLFPKLGLTKQDIGSPSGTTGDFVQLFD